MWAAKAVESIYFVQFNVRLLLATNRVQASGIRIVHR